MAHLWRPRVGFALKMPVLLIAMLISEVSCSNCDIDGTCASDQNTLLQSVVSTHFAPADLSTQSVTKSDSKDNPTLSYPPVMLRTISLQHDTKATNSTTEKDSVDEAQTAPKWWQNMLIFFSFITIVMLIMLAILACLQRAINYQIEVQKAVLENLSLRRRSVDLTEEEEETSGKNTRSAELDDTELSSLIAGDHKRLDALLQLAKKRSSDRDLQSMLGKCSIANKLKLSSRAFQQIGDGLLALARFAQDREQRKSAARAGLTPRDKLKKAMKHVLMEVRVCRAMKAPLHKDHQEKGWTCKKDQSEQLADKYSDGHKDSMHGGYKDTRLGKAMGSYFASDRWIDHSAIGFVFIYSQTCAGLYAFYLRFRFPKMYAFMGPWLLVSRGEAMAVIVLTVLMVVLLTRGLVTKLREYLAWSTVLQTILDKHVLIHRSIGVMLVICALFHVLGHLRGSIPAIIAETDTSKIEQAFTYGTKMKFNFNSWGEAAVCYPAVTGYCLLAILALFWALSNERVRRAAFEYFHYPHLILVTLWSIMLVMHGARQWLGIGIPIALVAVVPVVIYYFVERVYHIYCGQGAFISNAVLKKHNVLLEIDIGDTGYQYETGMYCMIKVPEVSHYQWHPFTIASAGGQQKFQLLFAVVGDWTTEFNKLLGDAQQEAAKNSAAPKYPAIAIRGGYGAPAEGMKDCKNIVMVGAGVGATPFLSFLSNITNAAKTGKLGNGSQFDGLESAVFYWISREPEDFVWVNGYNSIITNDPVLNKILSIRLVLTKSMETSKTEDCSATDIALFWCGVQVALKSASAKGLAEEIGAPTQFGRPNWENELGDIKTDLLGRGQHYTKKDPLEVSVFACGNQMLVASLDDACAAVTTPTAQFRLLAEEF